MSKNNYYKADTPENTINRIRNIFNQIGLQISESSGSHGDFFHSHLWISNSKLNDLKLSSNGKGSTPLYALASAYAEMIERIQNSGIFFGEKYSLKSFLCTLDKDSQFYKKAMDMQIGLDFEFFPDEVEMTINDLILKNPYIFGEKQSKYLKEHNDINYKIKCVPYYNVVDNNLMFFPVKNSTIGSNGMCAGNSHEEAIVQGICEVFERFVVKKVFSENIVLPIIPISLFSDTEIYKKVIKLKVEKNIDIIVLDGSLDIGLPVIGTIIIDKIQQKYRIMMGSSPSAEIALERCLTEFFQGFIPFEKMNEINFQSSYLYRNKEDINYINLYHQLTEVDGEIDVYNYLISAPSYNYNEQLLVNHSMTLSEQLAYLYKIIVSNDYKLYIRNNTTLSFPSYHVVIQGMSEVFSMYNSDDIYVDFKLSSYHRNLYSFKNQSDEKVLEFSKLMDQFYDKVRSAFRTIKGEFLYHTNKDIEDIQPYLFLATSFLYTGDYLSAIKYIVKFIEDEKLNDSNADLTYYLCAKHFLELRMEKSIEESIETLIKLYDNNLVENVAQDLGNSKQAFQYYNLPSCFECEKCPISYDCRYFDVMALVKKVQIQMNKKINQKDISTLFIQ